MKGVSMKWGTTLLLMVLGVVGLGFSLMGQPMALAIDPSLTLPENPLQGRELLVSKGCLNCHPILGEGGTIGPDLGKRHFNMSLSRVASVMWNHAPFMLEEVERRGLTWPTFSEEEMANLIAFLYYMDYYLGSLQETGDTQRGRQLFVDKGCKTCHTLGGEGGGNIGPSLDRVRRYMSPIFMAQALWNHGPEMADRMQQLGLAIPTFEGNEMVDLIVYIRTAGQGEVQKRMYLPPGNPRQGGKLFVSKGCTTCHALGGVGGGIGPDLVQEQFRQSLTRIAGIMWNHGPKMWHRMAEMGLKPPKLTVTEMADLVAYLYFLGYIDEPGNPVTGQRLFAAKQCVTCHAIKGEGGSMGPDLGESSAVLSALGAATAMWNHAPRMQQFMQEQDIPWPRLSGTEMIDLIAYLRSVQQGPGNPATGQRLFTAKQCIVCHAIKGKGGSVGPDLGESSAVLTPMGAAAALWNHAPMMQKLMQEQNITWTQLTEAEVIDLIAYLRSVRHVSPTQQ
jgi:mono/diheme cytochrome c family protein